jgi:hypothetical protein
MMTRNALLTALLMASLATLVACGGTTPKVDGGTGGGGGTSGQCLDDTDCPDPTLFFCNTTTSMCEPSCRTAPDCGAARRGQYALDFCAGALGCQCDEGKCVGSLCSVDSDCGANSACRSGGCVTPPAASTVASCRITPDFVVLKPGAKATFWVSAWDASKAPVTIQAGATWSAPSGSPLTGSGTGNSQDFTAGATATAGTTGVVSVQASYGSVNCTASAIVLPAAPAAGEVYVAVTDELSGRPVANADVLLSNPDGTVVQQAGSAASVKTDARGFATLTGRPATAYSVSVFDADHSYLTIANYQGTSNYLSVVTRRNQLDKYGGFTGTYTTCPVGSTAPCTGVPNTSNVHAAITGMSLPGSITSLSLSQLLGPSVPTDVKIGTAINQTGVPIPSGVYLGFGAQQIKANVAGQGLAGVCTDSSGAPDEANIAAGNCGTRTIWSLAGDVPLGDLPISALAGGLSNIDVGALLSQILPIFRKFNSTVTRDVQFTLQKPDGGSVSDQSFFTKKDQEFAQVPLAFALAAKLPDLPKYRGAYVDAAAIIGGANVPGQGVVPLGIGVGVNTDGNAQTDIQSSLPSAGLVGMRMAPTHHGLEGGQYGLLVAAISAKALQSASAGVGASAIFARLPKNALIFDPAGTSPVDLTSLSFPAFPDGAKFNFADAATPGIPGRSFRLVSAPQADFTGMSVVKITFADGQDHRWEVLVDATKVNSTSGFTLPKPPGVYGDRLFANNLSSGNRSGMAGQVLRLNSAPGTTTGVALSFNDYVEMNSTNADRTTDYLTGFSFLDYGTPSIKFTAPTAATLAKGGKVSVAVSKFKLGTTADAAGQVLLTATSNNLPVVGCDPVLLSTETTAGNGAIDYTLPMACVGASIVFKAELVRIDATIAVPAPIAPAVFATTSAIAVGP